MATDPRTDQNRPLSPPEEPGVSQSEGGLRSAFGRVPPALERGVDELLSQDALLWGFVGLAMVLDIALTGVGLSLGLQERNPVAFAFIERFGLLGAGVLLKGLVLSVGVGNWLLLPRLFPTQGDRRYLIPLALALPSWAVVVLNAVLVLSVL